jgi:hypothetical protein
MEGGIAYFPGLSKRVSVDADQLPEDARAELETLVKETNFFELPDRPVRPRKKGADYYQYLITIEAGGRRNTLHLVDPIENPGLQRLVGLLRKRAKEILSAGRKPGPGG